MLTLYRVSKAKYADSLMSGVGAARYGGHWNSPDPFVRWDRRLVYASSSLPLAMLEVLVHARSADVFRTARYVYAELKVREAADTVATLDPASLPADWDAVPETTAT